MDILKIKGTPREVGRQYGEAYREGFHAFHQEAASVAASRPHWASELDRLRESIRSHFPRIWEEMVGAAEGANLPLDKLLLNHRYVLQAEEGCTNVAFLDTPEGPVFGKNLDMNPDSKWQWVVRHVQYEDGNEVIHTTHLGNIMGRVASMNMRGLMVGAGSVGSVFQKSLDHPPLDDAIYAMIASCATTAEAIRFMQRYPYFGKGNNYLLVDATGDAAVLECACPLMQVRRPAVGEDALFCANTFKLPTLLHAHRRTPAGWEHSERRFHYLERKIWEERVPHTVEQIKALLASQGPEGGLCNPAFEGDDLKTRLSVVALPAERRFELADGQPCESPFLPVL